MAVVINGTTGIDKVQDGSIGTADLASGAVTAAKLNVGQIGGRRNLAINGAMQVAQRGTSTSSVTTSGYYTVDRFGMALGTYGTWTVSQETDGPTGFKYSNKWLCTTANASPTSTQYGMVYQAFEARDFRGMGYGSSDAKNLTISFWVKSNKTGSASVGAFFYDDSNNYFHSKQYTINSADTWEHKIVTIAPDTTHSLRTPDQQQGFTVEWFLGGGSNYTGGSHNTWTTSQTNRNVSNIGIGTAVNDYLQLTGVQIEFGDTATPFEHRSYGEELAACQRYYFAFIDAGSGGEAWVTTATCYNTTNAYGGVRFPVSMRAIPTLKQYTGTDVWQLYNNTQADRFDSFTMFGATQSTKHSAMIYNNDVIAITAGQSGNFQGGNSACYLHFDAEL